MPLREITHIKTCKILETSLKCANGIFGHYVSVVWLINVVSIVNKKEKKRNHR